jgi:hypothetical protein
VKELLDGATGDLKYAVRKTAREALRDISIVDMRPLQESLLSRNRGVSSALSENVDPAMVNGAVQLIQSNSGWVITGVIASFGVVASIAGAVRMFRDWRMPKKKQELRKNEIKSILQKENVPDFMISSLVSKALFYEADGKKWGIFSHTTYEPTQQDFEDWQLSNEMGAAMGSPAYQWSSPPRAQGEWRVYPIDDFKNESDSAMNGGIDIQNIDVNKTGHVRIQFNDDVLKQILDGGFNGFTPVFIKMTPVDSPLAVFGMN